MNSGKSAIAGPGHRPPIPHPTPNNEEPRTNLRSMTLVLGISKESLRRGLSTNLKVMRLILTATNITNASEARYKFKYLRSQCEFNVRNPIILVLRTIPETTNPDPNINPTNVAMRASFKEYLFLYI